jgi:CRP/FNR family transcriptional regulator, cyclic AMP receptor protein
MSEGYCVAMAHKKEIDLADIWLFASCSGRDLRHIRQSLDEVAVSAGRVLCQEGSVGREFFLIVDGQASVRRKERKVATLGPGSYFGELALLDRQPRSASIVADTDMDLLVLEQRAFIGVLDSVPSLARKLLVSMTDRLREADPRSDSDMFVLLLEQRPFVDLLDQEPAMARRLLSAMAVRLREADAKAFH